MMNLPKVRIIVVAAGVGSRFGSAMPKQFCRMNDRPILMITLGRLARYLPDARLYVVLSREMIDFWHEQCLNYGFSVEHTIVEGGATRFHSVKNAINYISDDVADAAKDDDIVLIHDGVRPCFDASLINRGLATLSGKCSAAIPVTPLRDSLRHRLNDETTECVERSRYVLVQTPQMFRFLTLRDAYLSAVGTDFTDDASVVEASGVNVLTFEGDVRNLKITNSVDLEIARIFSEKIDEESLGK